MTSFSKTLMPGLRLGMLVAPPALRERLTALRIAADLGSPLLLQRALAAFLQRGDFRRHLRRMLPDLSRSAATPRCARFEAFMPPGVQWTRPHGGLCCWLTLPPHPGLGATPHLMLQQGWAVAPGHVFLTGAAGDHHLRLCFGNSPDAPRERGAGQVIRHAGAASSWMP